MHSASPDAKLASLPLVSLHSAFKTLGGHLVLPDCLQVQILSSLGTTHTPPLSLVPRSKAECSASLRRIKTSSRLGIASLGRVGSRFELCDPLSLEGSLFRIWRIGNRLEAGDARAPRSRRGRRRWNGRGGIWVSKWIAIVRVEGPVGWRRCQRGGFGDVWQGAGARVC